MGLCGSSNLTPEQRAEIAAEKRRNQMIEKDIERAHMEEVAINKLLLLGAGESGKSTFFKQLNILYSEGYDLEARRSFVEIIRNNCIEAMETMCLQLLTNDEFAQVKASIDAGLLERVQRMSENKGKSDPEVYDEIDSLWKTAEIQEVYAGRSAYQLFDSANYFCDMVLDLKSDDWVPSQDDVLRSRVRTTGIVESAFEIEGNRFQIFDVGGQRNERKKWIHCFEDVTAVLFLVAMSGYDQTLFEDDSMNRMDEALALFEEICNSQWFKSTAMMLFLNKRDLFAEKIAKTPLTVWDPDYTGQNTYEEAGGFIQDRFAELNHNPQRTVYIHWTCATDTNNISAVFNATKDIVIRQSLREGGLLL